MEQVREQIQPPGRKGTRLRKKVDRLDPSHIPRPTKAMVCDTHGEAAPPHDLADMSEARSSRTAPLEAPPLDSAPAIDADTSLDPQTDDSEAEAPASEDSDTDSIQHVLVDSYQLPKQHTTRKGNATRGPDRSYRDCPQPTQKSRRTR
jgi:hypothetical protein